MNVVLAFIFSEKSTRELVNVIADVNNRRMRLLVLR